MKVFGSLAVLCLAISLVKTFEVYEDEDGAQFYLVPLSRHRRQTTVGIDKTAMGTRATIGHQGKIFENQVHRLDGGGFVSKTFRPSGPTTVGGNLGYQHKPSGSTLGADVARTKNFGTNLNLQGTGNLWRRGNSRLDAVGQYSRQFGGLGGTGRPDYYGGLQFNHRF